jgi:hypothetical protein
MHNISPFNNFPKPFAKWTPQGLISDYTSMELPHGNFNVPVLQAVDEVVQG